MATAIIGIGNIGGTVAKELAAGGESVVLSAGDAEAAKKLAAEIGGKAAAARSNRDAVERANTVVLALWLDAMKVVIPEIADLLPGKLVIDTSNPIAVGADGSVTRTLPEGQASGQVVSGLLPKGTMYAKAFGTLSAPMLASGAHRTPEPAVLFYATDDTGARPEVERLIGAAGFQPVRAGGVDASLRIEVGGDLHPFGGLNGRLIDRTEAESLVGSSVRA
ncbi:MAG TPA: NAD(P)-binding domain-containing protein [Candidatus Dormibacteraeota bacterium]|nr:NAD(P)-binding domain-containing protein [Candidatus Dormibacteraeota bacterium]